MQLTLRSGIQRSNIKTKSITGGGTFVTEWAYDAADLPTWMRYPDGEWVTTTYLRQKLVNSMSGSSLYVQSTQYDAAGRVELRLLGADQVRIDPYYRPWDTQGGRMHWLIGRVGSAGAFLQALEYAYDAVGNVSWIKDNLAGGVQTQSFSYDSMDRLLSAGAAPAGDGGDYSESYSYDSAGRLVNGPRGSGYVYGDAGHKHAVTAVSGGHSYAYDANGNLVSRTSGGQTLSFVYDAENRLVGVSGAASASFVYDGDGRRVKATVNGVTTYYVGDSYEVSGGVVKKYYSAGGQRIAMRSGGTLYWLLTDHLGGTAYTVSGTTRTGELRYRPFGVTRFTSGTTPTSYRFTGQREEAALGLYFYNTRWYDPALGQFLSPDTLVPEAGNALDYHRYAYVRFNPLKYEDESGHCATLANGEADWENDAACWQLAYAIYGYGLGDGPLARRFAADWKVSPEEWLTNVASQSFADADYLRPFAERYRTDWSRQAGLPVDPVQWHQPINPPVWLPGQGLAETVIYDISLCQTSWQDCGRALDDASLAASSVAVGCGVTGIAPCAGGAALASSMFSGAGAALTVYNAAMGENTWIDAGVSVATTAVGGSKLGAKPNGTNIIGWLTSALQWLWDH